MKQFIFKCKKTGKRVKNFEVCINNISLRRDFTIGGVPNLFHEHNREYFNWNLDCIIYRVVDIKKEIVWKPTKKDIKSMSNGNINYLLASFVNERKQFYISGVNMIEESKKYGPFLIKEIRRS